MKPKKEHRLLEEFRIVVSLKGAYALLELLTGLIALVVPPAALTNAIVFLTRNELSEDPHDFIANALLHWAQQLSIGVEIFAALYLISHGLIKFGVIFGLMKNQLWAYPLALWIFGAFAAYQTYLFAYDHSIAVALLTIFDLIVMWFIWREWLVQKAHRLKQAA